MRRNRKFIASLILLVIICAFVNIDVEASVCPHTTTERVKYNAPTCTEPGNIAYKLCLLNDCILNSNYEIIDISEVIIPPLGHTEEIIPGYEATCTEDGLTDGKKCKTCGEVFVTQEVIPSNGHTEVTETSVIKNATCVADGQKLVVIYCDVCNAELKKETVTIPAVGEHQYTEEVEGTRVPSTCVAQGSVNMRCVCGDTITVSIDADENAHSWGEWTVTETPTCTLKGEKVRICDYNSAHKQIIEVAENPDAHTIKSRVENEFSASCGTDGSYTVVVYCDACDKEISRESVTVPATGNHSYIFEVNNSRIEPTCVREGSVTMKCSCGATDTVALPVNKEAHKWSVNGTVTVEPTCVSQGEITYSCDNYGCLSVDKRVLSIDADAHKWDNGTLIQIATCSSEGLIEYCCIYSSLHKRTEQIPVDSDAHKALTETRNYVAATCGKSGSYDTVTFCNECKTVLQTVVNTIPATGEHNYIEEVSGTKVPPTCISDGSVTMKCICGAEKITKLSKDANAHIADSEGYDCILCGKELSCRHSWTTEKVITKESSCIENGSKAVICTKCNESKPGSVEIIPAYGHNFTDDWKPVTNPSCSNEGVKIRICRNCFDFETESIPKLNHTDKNKDYICDNCNTVTDMSAFTEKNDKQDAIEDNNTDNTAKKDCSCDCHKTGFEKVMFTIINFFQKLFGNNKVCECGVKH